MHHDAARTSELRAGLDFVASLVEESHFGLSLHACRSCGQRFVHLFAERIDWQGGEDPQDWLLIPISAAEADAVRVAGESAVRALPARRFLLRDWPSGSDGPEVGWRDGPVLVPPHD